MSGFTKISDGAMCVKNCPKKDMNTIDGCAPTNNVNDCNVAEQYATSEFLGYCIPSNFNEVPAPIK